MKAFSDYSMILKSDTKEFLYKKLNIQGRLQCSCDSNLK